MGRAVKRYWPWMLLLWIGASAALMTLAFIKIPPLYTAYAVIEVAPPARDVYGRSFSTDTINNSYLETHVQKITNTKVLATALADKPQIADLPILKSPDSAEAAIRENLVVGGRKGTNLIQVAMTSENPYEAAEIVNAVVDAYLKTIRAWSEQETTERINRYKTLVSEHEADVRRLRSSLETLAKSVVTTDLEALRDHSRTSVENYRKLSDRLREVELARGAAEQVLDRVRGNHQAAALSEEEIEDAVIELFYSDPRVDRIQAELLEYQEKLGKARRVARAADPAQKHWQEKVEGLQAERDRLWIQRNDQLRRRITAGSGGDLATRLAASESEVTRFRAEETMLRETLRKAKVENDLTRNNEVKVEYARIDLDKAENQLARVESELRQAMFEAKNPSPVQVLSDATPRGNASTNKRWRVMAVVPVTMLAAVLGLFLLVESRSGRVADPEELFGRARLPVLGVVPPLPPSLEGISRPREELKARRKIDAFVQSLDHLRVTICSSMPDARLDLDAAAGFHLDESYVATAQTHRCVLITSAVGSEGKTTLAANLAYRCANAGLRTLLIDADLRSPALSAKLGVPAGPGLVEVLRGLATLEQARVVARCDGGDPPTRDVLGSGLHEGEFHVLGAGSDPNALPVDPNRLLVGSALGRLLREARARYDVVLVDAPPVLPVPDALSIGPWTDGAVLAVRHDASRLPLIERAQARLAHVGVHVLGAVVNGVPGQEASYGGYGYGYGSYGYGSGPQGRRDESTTGPTA